MYGAFVEFLSERMRRRTEPYLEIGAGGYHFTDDVLSGGLAPYAEAGVGLQFSRIRLGLRYGRVFDNGAEALADGRVAYLNLVLGLDILIVQ
jgi:hypothetical protein